MGGASIVEWWVLYLLALEADMLLVDGAAFVGLGGVQWRVATSIY